MVQHPSGNIGSVYECAELPVVENIATEPKTGHHTDPYVIDPGPRVPPRWPINAGTIIYSTMIK
jgi:hypothetical protein